MKILMALMGLEIGGAETHVLELCKVLAKRGHEIFVASNGGVYEKELDTVSIKHFKVPLHNKKVSSFIKSYALLKNKAGTCSRKDTGFFVWIAAKKT